MTTALDTDWQAQAACRDHDPRLWFPERTGPQKTSKAVQICDECPVKDACHADAERRDEPFGIWGGKPRKGTSLGKPHRHVNPRSPAERARTELATSKCVECGNLWANNAGARHSFAAVSKICPECVEKLPVEPWGLVR